MRAFLFIALLVGALAGGAALLSLQLRAPADDAPSETPATGAPEPSAAPEPPASEEAEAEPDAVIALPSSAEPETPRPEYREAPYPAQFVIPVMGVEEADLREDWGDPRSGGRTHQGLDIPAETGTPVMAADAGEIMKFFDSDAGGTTIYQSDSSGRYVLYYAHLDARARGLTEGDRVRAGQIIGYVGTTGNAPENAPHLHFEVNLKPETGSWYGGEPVNPYPLLAGTD